MKVLIIEDNDILRKNVKTYLEIKEAEVDEHSVFDGAVYKIMTGIYDVIILDLGLGSGDDDGIKICKEVREKGSNIPILMLTARTLTKQKIDGLNSGADDYMIKPFDYEELFARIKSMSRRNDSLKGQELVIGNIHIDLNELSVKKDAEEISLSKLEFNLLVCLAQNKGNVMTKEQIHEKVWGEIDLFKESRTVDIYIGYLRKKLGAKFIETVRGVGYIIK